MTRHALTLRRWWYRQSIRRQAIYIAAVVASLIFVPLYLLGGPAPATHAATKAGTKTTAAAQPASTPRAKTSATPSSAASPMTVVRPPSKTGLVRFAASQGHGKHATGSTSAHGPSAAGRHAGPILTYTVRPGDTLSAIAARFGTDYLSLEVANGLGDNSVLQPGQKLTVLTMVGYIDTIRPGDTLSGIAAASGVSVASLAAANHIPVDATLTIGKRLVVPAQPHPGHSGGGAAAGGHSGHAAPAHHTRRLSWPVKGPITSPFGWRKNPFGGAPDFHHGIDIGVPMHTPVHAAASGTVEYAGWDGGYGYAVIINNGGGIKTLYAHNSRLVVHPGERVARGQLISYSGMTGHATGPHVHFGVYVNGTPVNPMKFLK